MDTEPMGWAATAAAAGDQLRDEGRWRVIRSLAESGPRTMLADGTPVVQFASNDYLGLSLHPLVIAAANEATERWGTGSGASRLVVGSRAVHDELEADLATWKHAASALLFSTGYAANVGVLTSLARLGVVTDRPIAIVSDELNHASIIDGARLARVPIAIYPHADVDAAAAALSARRAEGFRPVLVTDTVFSMDGDVAPLAALVAAARAVGALVVLDDAHAVFAGAGADAVVGAADGGGGGGDIVIVGTLSKTLGVLGGFVAGPTPLVEWFRNTARSFIYSTASPPSAAAAARAALAVLRSADGDALVDSLRANVDRLAPGNPSAVVPVVIGDERAALDVSDALLDRGLLVPAIRPPTVPVGTSRLRVALSALHTPADVDRLVDALREVADWNPAPPTATATANPAPTATAASVRSPA